MATARSRTHHLLLRQSCSFALHHRRQLSRRIGSRLLSSPAILSSVAANSSTSSLSSHDITNNKTRTHSHSYLLPPPRPSATTSRTKKSAKMRENNNNNNLGVECPSKHKRRHQRPASTTSRAAHNTRAPATPSLKRLLTASFPYYYYCATTACAVEGFILPWNSNNNNNNNYHKNIDNKNSVAHNRQQGGF
mmetsp:Transcript_10121/g.21743  ORF Transcript_10121/g.21743 Transcript_10121/m.21743 type:complete len:192 (-) Transcript_10121:1033-1608(-)